MSRKILVKRGLKAQLPTLSLAELALTTDEGKLYVGGTGGNISLPTQAEVNSKTKSYFYTHDIEVDWVGTTAPFTQELEVTGMKSTYRPFVDIRVSGDAEIDARVVEEFGKILSVESKEGAVVFSALEKTEVSIPIQMEVFA